VKPVKYKIPIVCTQQWYQHIHTMTSNMFRPTIWPSSGSLCLILWRRSHVW